MWNKLIFGSLAAAMITACGPAVSEEDQTVDDSRRKMTTPEPSALTEFPFSTIGLLPETAPSAAVQLIQTRVSMILEMGLSDDYFTDNISDPDTMLLEVGGAGQPQGWTMVGNARRLYLMKRHLRPVLQNISTREFSEFCGVDNLYSGYVAARPFTEQTVQAEALLEITASPYGLLVCDQADKLKLKLLNADHPILTN